MIEIIDSEKTGIRSLSVHIMRFIAEQHGGAIEKDLLTDAIDIWVPAGKQSVCAKEIDEKLGAMNACIYTLSVSFLSGMEPAWISRN